MSDDEDIEKKTQDHNAAMQAAKEGRAQQLAQYERYIKGEHVDFKNHQGLSFVEVYDPNVYQNKKTTRVDFLDKYRFFDAVLNSDEDTGRHGAARCRMAESGEKVEDDA